MSLPTHGHSYPKSPTYISWMAMRQRCLNKNHKSFCFYGGRGITISKRWMNFENFLEDMGERPSGKTIDRINGEKNYCKKNCKWSTSEEQGSNKKNNYFISYNGKTLCLAGWSKELKLSRAVLYSRKKSGWEDLEIIGIKVHIKNKEIKAEVRTLYKKGNSTRKIGKILGICHMKVWRWTKLDRIKV